MTIAPRSDPAPVPGPEHFRPYRAKLWRLVEADYGVEVRDRPTLHLGHLHEIDSGSGGGFAERA